MFPGLEDPTPGTKGCQGRVVVDPVLLPQTCSMLQAVYQRDGAIGLRHCLWAEESGDMGWWINASSKNLASNDFYPLFAVVTGWLGWIACLNFSTSVALPRRHGRKPPRFEVSPDRTV